VKCQSAEAGKLASVKARKWKKKTINKDKAPGRLSLPGAFSESEFKLVIE